MGKNNIAYGLSKERSELEQRIGLDPNSYSNGFKAGQLQVLQELMEEVEKKYQGNDIQSDDILDLLNQKIVVITKEIEK